ncbi:MAG TPA: ParB N-terminal domain-containing protein [Albitalea sp.]|nr:ParB N-terminal domain-containing protein [Albitalea sp.]
MNDQINPALEKLAVPIKVLRPDPENARRHEQRSIDAIKASYEAFGQQKPVVVLTDGTVIDGNGQLEAARQLGWERLAVVKFEDTAKAKAYAVAINRSAELSGWDEAQLAKTLDELSRLDGFDAASVGFTDAEMMKLIALASETETFAGDIPPPLPVRVEGGNDGPVPPPSHVRMVQLFFDEHTQLRFVAAVKKLAHVYGTTNATDTVLRCVEQLAAQLEPKTADAKQAPAA